MPEANCPFFPPLQSFLDPRTSWQAYPDFISKISLAWGHGDRRSFLPPSGMSVLWKSSSETSLPFSQHWSSAYLLRLHQSLILYSDVRSEVLPPPCGLVLPGLRPCLALTIYPTSLSCNCALTPMDEPRSQLIDLPHASSSPFWTWEGHLGEFPVPVLQCLLGPQYGLSQCQLLFLSPSGTTCIQRWKAQPQLLRKFNRSRMTGEGCTKRMQSSVHLPPHRFKKRSWKLKNYVGFFGESC